MKRLVLFTLLSLACLLPPSGAAGQKQKQEERPCNVHGTQAEATECAHKEFKAADAKLNAVYKQLSEKLDEAAREKLKSAELAWLNYRNANCDYEDAFYTGGTMRPMITAFCMARMTRARTAELLQQVKDLDQ